MDLSIVIVNYNVKYFLEQCLYAAMRACAGLHAEIFVVDNHSTDGSREYLEPKFKNVKFYWNKENLGFGKANNSVLPFCKGKYILFLNPDTIIGENSLMYCIEFFKKNPLCGAVGVHMVDGSGNFLQESKRNLPTPSNSFYKMAGLASRFPNSKVLAGYYATQVAEKDSGEVEVLAGAFMMLNKAAIEKTNGFDEDFFMYGEDVDLSYRIIKAGFKNYYLGNVSIIHFKGESVNKNSEAYLNNFYGAMSLFVAKHYSQKTFSSFVLKMGIALGKAKAGFFAKQNSEVWQKHISTIIVSTAEEAALIAAALKENSLAENITLLNAEGNKIKNAFKEKITSSRADSIVLSTACITNEEIILLLQTLRGNLQFYIHQQGSQSIVGSNDKDGSGTSVGLMKS